ncbi:circadian clock protein KaiC [Planktothrix sp. FACHB-1355]|uniref:non-specific serine/threonine protein kinase n=1 Tax=Aerosakkonema funiforme FACHB-1375 TaxID=2949571 RepID=A0A926ZH53_9CYAN|nr:MULTISPECIES: circadian clock protein KaiC [Oscillatoriales]MBD2182918.1 circadian clock protein KaiC [Aerosakkonema funiforme FACHB-1375]MBD3557376.1 circadian clock protein KaiC [Planktothrix sp. FACHB-1355]
MTEQKTIAQPHKAILIKCPTGIQGLDEITDGGLPQGRPTLICGKAGCGKTLMAMEFLVRGALEYDEPGIFMSFEESAQELTENVASLGWDLKDLIAEKKMGIYYVHVERSQIQETGEYDLEALFARLGYGIDSINAKRVVLDTIEVLFGGLSNEAVVRAELRRLFLWLKSKGVTAIVTSESGNNTLTRHGLEEYVSDCVIRLDQRVNDELSTRRLHIVKYRGSRHGTNEYPFLIQENGISVLPITSIALEHEVSNERISSGIDRLDTMLGGNGFFRGSSILISGTAGTGKSSISAHFANATCQRGERCLYFAFEESANQIVRNMRSIGIDLETAIKKGLLKIKALRPTMYGLEMHLVNIHQLVNEFKPTAIIIDPISNLTYTGNESQVKSFLMRSIDFFKTKQITTLLTSLNSSGALVQQTDVGVSSLMDTWLMLRDIESNGERNRLLYVLKSRGMEHSNQVREFRLTSSGVELVDVYLGAGGVVTGTARTVQEAQEKAAALAHRQEIEQKYRDIERKRKVMEAQITALQAEFENEKEQVERIIQQEEQQEVTLLQERRKRADMRRAD